MTKTKTNYLGAFALLFVGAAGVYGVGTYINKTPNAAKVPDAVRRHEDSPAVKHRPAPDVETSVVKQTEESATILTPESKDGNLTFTSKKESVPAGVKPIIFAVNRYLENTGFVSKRAKAIGVDLKDGVAHIDVTEAFETTYGTMDEQTVLEGLQRTLGQFKEVDKAMFFVSGKQVTSLGNADLTAPIEVIRPGSESTQSGV